MVMVSFDGSNSIYQVMFFMGDHGWIGGDVSYQLLCEYMPHAIHYKNKQFGVIPHPLPRIMPS